MTKTNKKSIKRPGNFIIVLVVISMVFLGVMVTQNEEASPVKPIVKVTPVVKPADTTPSVSNSTSSDKSASTQAYTSQSLVAPTGTFVSNHKPNLGGKPAPSTENSICNTVPGSSCVITFTKDGVSKSLVSKSADSTGSVSWDWDLKDIGITVGTWSIKAIATLNGASLSSSDPTDLVVSQ